MWNISFSLFAIVSFVAVAVSLYLFFSKNREHSIKITHVFMAYCFFSTIILCAPAFICLYEEQKVNPLSAGLMAFAKAIKVFGGDAIFDDVMTYSGRIPGEIFNWYLGGLLLVQFLAPVCTVSFALSFLKNLYAYAGYFARFFKDAYVFSQLNEKTFALASSIREKDKKSVIIFTDVFDEEMKKGELAKKAKQSGALLFVNDILAVNFKRHSRKKRLSFLLMSDDENLNTVQGLKLIKEFSDRDNTDVYVMSTKIESELLLSASEKGKVKVRRINETVSLVNRILYDNEMELFKRAIDCENGERLVSALVVGMGSLGTETVKALSWFCQMDGYNVKINAFDKDKLSEDRFKAAAPELMSESFNGRSIPGEARYTIKLHPGVDVGTLSFYEKVREIGNITYVMVCLGDDELNIKTAVELRTLFERMGIKPFIHAVVYGSEQKRVLDGLKNYSGQSYDICFTGDLETSFSADSILHNKLEKEALSRHIKWGSEEEFWNYEYNYRSSVAAALHIRARIACGIQGASKKEEELTPEEKISIENLEHRRWNAYMRSEGYIYSGSPDKKSRNNLGKMHHNLVPYEVLSDEDKAKDSKVGTIG